MVDRSSPDLKGLAVGVGAFGIITRLFLDIQPTYMVRQDVYRDAPWDIVLDGFDEVMASAYSVSLWVPRTRSRHATCRYSCTRPPSRSRRSGRMVAPEGGGVGPAGGC